MTEEEAIKFLSKCLDEIPNIIMETAEADAIIDGYINIIALIRKLKDENDSVWSMVEEMRLSEISQHTNVISLELEKIIKDKRNIAKVSEA